jgi:hypothetical protein
MIFLPKFDGRVLAKKIAKPKHFGTCCSPAKAGVHFSAVRAADKWVPAFAGKRNYFAVLECIPVVIPGHRVAMNPGPMNTDFEQLVSTPQHTLDETVFMGSGFGPLGRPGMTRVILGQAFRGY